METKDYLKMLVHEIHSTVVATVNENGIPFTCVIDMMDFDETGLYFLTAKGKPFYSRLKTNPTIAITGFKGPDTMHTTAISITGKVTELGSEPLSHLFKLNPYMADIYPNEESRSMLTVFKLISGTGEVFKMFGDEITRDIFAWGGEEIEKDGYRIIDTCTNCGLCAEHCPRNCIDISCKPAFINQNYCIVCGKCAEVCPVDAVKNISSII